MSEVRKEIVWFSKEMEAKLKKYDSKGGWEDLTTVHLLGRIKDELKELEEEFENDFIDITAAVRECADIANFCMMIADNLKREV